MCGRLHPDTPRPGTGRAHGRHRKYGKRLERIGPRYNKQTGALQGVVCKTERERADNQQAMVGKLKVIARQTVRQNKIEKFSVKDLK